jgi:hypothetical protein
MTGASKMAETKFKNYCTWYCFMQCLLMNTQYEIVEAKEAQAFDNRGASLFQGTGKSLG